MAFSGCEFSFDGRPSREFGLVIYSLDSYRQDSTFTFASAGKLLEDRPEGRVSSLTYGKQLEEPMQFTLVFGVRDDYGKPNYLDRWDVENIASWLTSPKGYRWLEIDQPDMQDMRFRCMISSLESISFSSSPLAFRCKVSCDSPYAYSYPETYTINVMGETKRAILKNRSTNGEFYYPKVEIEMNGGTRFSIVNHSVNNETLAFEELPASLYAITVDGENEVITTTLDTLNPYEKFNCCFLKLCKGDNLLSFSGNGLVRITCEFPRNIGG